MKGPGQVLCINLFSPDFIDCVKAMPPGDRVYGVRWVQQSDACSMKKVRSLEISQVVTTITICCCYCSLLLNNTVFVHLRERHSKSLCRSCTFPFPELTCIFVDFHQRLIKEYGAYLSSLILRTMKIDENLSATKLFSTSSAFLTS